jgi:hypothetical protein
MIGAMLKQKGARGKTKPAVHFATDLAREGLCARIKLGASVCGLSVAQTLRALPNSCLPKPTDNIGAPQ